MKSSRKAENQLFTIYSIILLIMLYSCAFVGSMFGSLGKIVYFEIGSLTLPSLGVFVVVCLLAIWRRSNYFLFMIFIILAFPAPIDDLFPSVLLSNPDDKTEVFFPMITRIDLYLILGIILKMFQGIKVKVIRFNFTMKILIMLYSLVLLTNILKSQDLHGFNLLISYSFHIRYLLLFLILLQLYDIRKYEKKLVIGFVLSLLFLYFEANLNTYVRGSERLLSGSLALNTFANISGAIAVYLIFLIKNHRIERWMGVFGLIIAALIIIGSGTRGAILTVVLTLFALSFISDPKKFVKNTLKASLALLILLLGYYYGSTREIIPKRYSFEEITKKINIDFSKEGINEIINVERSWETNSIRARIDLFNSSLSMIGQHPWTGIGSGRWNRYKNTYVEEKNIPKVLIDSHNDYLSLMAQYGIILGMFFSIVVFYYPMKLSKKTMTKYDGPLIYLYVIPFSMGIAALSNSGFFKHQIAATLIFCLCIAYNLYYKYE